MGIGRMRNWIVLGVMIGMGGFGVASAVDLEALRWDRRVLLLFGDLDSAGAREQMAEWDADGMAERDLTVIRVNESGAADKLMRQFAVSDGQFEVILLGKDGGEKLRTREFLANAELFAVIDAMPMRQREMRER